MFLLTRLQSSTAARSATPTSKLSAAMLLLPTAVLPIACASTRAAAAAAICASGECPSSADVAQALAAAPAMPASASAAASPTSPSSIPASAAAISAPTPSPSDIQAALAVFSAGADAASETSAIALQFWKRCKRRCDPTKSASPYELTAPTGVPSAKFLAKMAAMEAARAATEPAPEPDHTPTDEDARAVDKTAAAATTKTTAPTETTAPTKTTARLTMAAVAAELLTVDDGAASCVLLGTSLRMEAVQRSKTDRARRILEDLRVVFREMDAATSQQRELLDAMTDISGVKGKFPQLFVTTRASAVVQYVSLEQLETVDFYSGVPREELARLQMEHATARALFPGVATVTPTFNAMPALQRALA